MTFKDLMANPITGPFIFAIMGALVIAIFYFLIDLFASKDDSLLYKWFSKLRKFNKRVIKKLRL